MPGLIWHAADEKKVDIYGLTTNFYACMPNVVGTYLCPHRHCAYMWASQHVFLVLLFISPLLLLVHLCVLWLYIIVLVVLSSVRQFVWYSDHPSVCLPVCMYTCTYVETNVPLYVPWASKIELTWLILCLVWVFTGHSFHLVVVVFFVSWIKRRHCRYVHIFNQKLCLRTPKSTQIFVSDNIVLFHNWFMTVTKGKSQTPYNYL